MSCKTRATSPATTPKTVLLYDTAANQLDGNVRYAGLSGQALPGTNATERRQVVAIAGTIKNLRFLLLTAPTGAGKSRTVTLQVNGVNSVLTCTCTNLETAASDLTNQVAVAAGDTVQWAFTFANAPSASIASVSCEFDPS